MVNITSSSLSLTTSEEENTITVISEEVDVHPSHPWLHNIPDLAWPFIIIALGNIITATAFLVLGNFTALNIQGSSIIIYFAQHCLAFQCPNSMTWSPQVKRHQRMSKKAKLSGVSKNITIFLAFPSYSLASGTQR